MKLQHGRLTVDVPPGWADQSTLLFVGPAPDVARTTTRVTQPSEAVAITFAGAGDDDARAMLGQESARLKKVDPELTVVEEGAFACGLGNGWSTVQRYRLGSTMLRQISVCVVHGPVAVLASASAADAAFDKKADTLWGVLRSLDFANDPKEGRPS